MMVNGKILVALNFKGVVHDVIPSPSFFYEYDYTQNTFTEVPGPGNPGAPSVWTDCPPPSMLNLPDGTVLMASGCDTSQLYVYQPSGTPLASGTPSITGITVVSGGFQLTGTGLNGISEGSSYGDDAQNASNYPLVRLTAPSGVVTYAQTYNWSSTGVSPGAQGNTDFALPPGTCGTSYSLQVVANGNSSTTIPFSTPACALLHIRQLYYSNSS